MKRPTGPTFLYAGADLAPLLATLLEQHDAELTRLDAELERFTPSQRIAAAAPPQLKPTFEYDNNGNIRPKRAEALSEVAVVAYARQAAYVKMRETELWLIECRRRPTARWRLTLADLDHLYPAKTSRGTLAAWTASPSAPLSWWSRFAARLAGWLVPRRQSLPDHSPTA